MQTNSTYDVSDNSRMYLHNLKRYKLTEYSDMNKPHLFSITQHRFSLIQMVTVTCMLQVSACTEAIFRHVNTQTLQRKVQ